LGLILTFHASGDKLNPASGDPVIRQRSQTWLEASLDIGAALGAQAIAVHPGQKDSADDSAEEVWEHLMPWVVRLDELAAGLEVRVGLELMEKLPLEVFMLPRDAARLMPLPLAHIGLTVDIAHMNTHGDPLNFLQSLDPGWIYHVHLSDNALHRVHLPLGDGEMALGVVLEAVEKVYQGIVSIEGSMPGQGEFLLQRNLDYLHKLGF
jgi:sugar phosphate isomerase/epimerase